jgi:L-threonylcarbamoyladenylate synthase
LEAVTGTEIHEAARLLSEGSLVAIPTETVYGLAANALDPKAVAGIFEVKKRPFFDPLIVHISDIGQIEKYASSIPEPALKLADALWPGPLTLLLPKKALIPDIVTAGLNTMGLRVPAHPLTLELLSYLPFPLAAPSANPFGYISPTTALHVADQLGNSISYILDGGPCKVGIESTIAGFEGDTITIHRLGGISLETLEEISGTHVQLRLDASSNPASPGQLATHYAPQKPFLLGVLPELIKQNAGKRIALISFSEPHSHPAIVRQWQLSPASSLTEAACNLFSVLRKADKSDSEIILAEPVPSHGIGLAINDRLRRAAA